MASTPTSNVGLDSRRSGLHVMLARMHRRPYGDAGTADQLDAILERDAPMVETLVAANEREIVAVADALLDRTETGEKWLIYGELSYEGVRAVLDTRARLDSPSY